jgi:PAS domain S-box-containing protein
MAIMVGILKHRAEHAFETKKENAALTEQIAERAQAEQALRESENRYRGLFDGVPVGLLRTTPEGRFLDANPALVEMFGFPNRDALLAVNINDLYVDPQERQRARAQADRMGSVSGLDLQLRRKDGTCIWVRVNGRAVRDTSGQVSHYEGAMLDITDRRRAEATRYQLAAIVESSDDAILGKTLEGMILSWNSGAERIYGYSAEEVVGRPVSLLVPPDRTDEVPKILDRIKRGEGIEHYETVRVRKDGRHIDVALTISPIRDAVGKIVGASTIARDITERKQAENAIHALNRELEDRVRQRTMLLEGANDELEAFAYTVAHDLRAPLITIDGFSHVLLEDYAPSLPDEAQSLLHQVADNTRQLGNLIDELLTFSRLNRQPVNEQLVAPADVARQALAELNGAQAERHATVVIGNLPVCRADPVLLKQVFVNLLSNALKFTRHRQGAAIEVGCRHDPDDPGHYTYFVKDNGAGFDMRYVDKLFRVFQRLHRAEDFEGTGVGLAIVRRIIRRHGGRVWAEGELDKGAVFYFTLTRSAAP